MVVLLASTIDITALTIGQVFSAFFIVIAVVFSVYKACTGLYGMFMKAHNAKSKNETFVKTVNQHEVDICSIKSTQNNLCVGMQCLIRDILKEQYDEYIKRGSVNEEELNEYIELYNSYHNLGGNSAGTRYFECVSHLPIIN